MNSSFNVDLCVCEYCVTQLWPKCRCILCLKLCAYYKSAPVFIELKASDTCQNCYPCSQVRSGWFSNVKIITYLGPPRIRTQHTVVYPNLNLPTVNGLKCQQTAVAQQQGLVSREIYPNHGQTRQVPTWLSAGLSQTSLGTSTNPVSKPLVQPTHANSNSLNEVVNPVEV